MRNTRSRVLALLTAGCMGLAAAPAFAQQAVLERDLTRLAALLAGDFDNQEQVYFEGELEVDMSLRHSRERQIIEAVEASDTATLAWRRLAEDSDTVTARGLWRLRVDAEAGALRMARWQLPLLADLERAAIEPDAVGSAQCDVIWLRRAAQFEGQVSGEDCDEANGAAWLIADSELQIPAASIDNEAAAEMPYILRRSRSFQCWLAIPKRDGENWHFESQLILPDQGGRAWVDTDEPEPQRVGIKIRNVAWPTGTNRDSLVLYVYRGEETSAASYAWGEPTATRLAINLRWMQTSCTLAE
ncbi:MAG: hypothetical protein AAF574_07040 [Pseudomonadota bacterium]